MDRIYFRALAAFWLTFGLITICYPRFMELFMTERGKDAGTEFSENVWLHDGLDTMAVAGLLFAFSLMPVSQVSLRASAIVSLVPVVAIIYSLLATPFWSGLFLLPAVAAVGLSVWGFMLSRGPKGDAQTAEAQPAVP